MNLERAVIAVWERHRFCPIKCYCYTVTSCFFLTFKVVGSHNIEIFYIVKVFFCRIMFYKLSNHELHTYIYVLDTYLTIFLATQYTSILNGIGR